MAGARSTPTAHTDDHPHRPPAGPPPSLDTEDKPSPHLHTLNSTPSFSEGGSGSMASPGGTPTASSSPLAGSTDGKPPHHLSRPSSIEPVASMVGLITVLHSEQLDDPSTTATTNSSLVAVVRFAQQESGAGTFSSHDGSPESPRLRILLGTSPLATKTEKVGDASGAVVSSGKEGVPRTGDVFAHLRLHADVPQSMKPVAPQTKLTVQAMAGETILDAVEYGYYNTFHLLPDASSPGPVLSTPASSDGRSVKREREDDPLPLTLTIDTSPRASKLTKRSSSEFDELLDSPRMLELAKSSSPSSSFHGMSSGRLIAYEADVKPKTTRAASPPSPMEGEFSEEQTTMRPRGKKPNTIIRSSQIRFKGKGHNDQTKVRLTLNHGLNEAVVGWSQEEYHARRRLVQFWRRQKGQDIQLSYKAIQPTEFVQGSNVVSCIFFEERDECYITSVDLISLLESLVGNRFITEEKNRIRRNLEGFKPETMSKSKSDEESQAFFSLIMGFGEPRPRNIEKDVKVFKWKLVDQAMIKILSKYSYVASKELLVNGDSAADDDALSSDDDSGERIAEPSKVEQDSSAREPAGATRSLRSRTSGRNLKSRTKPFWPTPITVKAEPISTPVLRPRPRLHNTLLGDNVSAEINAPPLLAHVTAAARAASAAGTGESSGIASHRPVLPRHHSSPLMLDIRRAPLSYTSSFTGASSEASVGEDSEVQDFLYETVAHMLDHEQDEVATQVDESPPPYAGTSGELDGIDGRSFQHPFQRAMQQERLERDMGTRRDPTEALPTPAFLDHLPHPAKQHVQQHETRDDRLLSPLAQPQPNGPVFRSESSLAHALDERYMEHTPSTPSSLQAESPFIYELAYPPHSAPPSGAPSHHLYAPTDLPISAGVHEPLPHPFSYIKNDSSWEEEEEDPNEYLVRASQQNQPNNAFEDPRFSYAAASHTQQWAVQPDPTIPYHYPYQDHTMS